MNILSAGTFKGKVEYSVIIPVHNEEECLKPVLDRVISVMENLHKSYEIICVDDGSTDRSWLVITEGQSTNKNIKGIRFLRNFGQQSAIHAGINECAGRYVAVMDADGQDPPEVLPDLIKKCEEGYDVVYAVRRHRKEGLAKRCAYKLFYLFYRMIVPFRVPLDAGDFGIFTRDVCEFLKSRTEKMPFIRGLRSWYGGKQTAFVYERRERIAGRTKYTWRKLIVLAASASVSFSKIPLRTISCLGILVSSLSFCAGVTIIILKLTAGIPLLGWTSTSVLIIFFGGLNLFVLGIIGEYIGSIFDEVKGRPDYLIQQKTGF